MNRYNYFNTICYVHTIFYYFYNYGFNFVEFVENKNSLNLLLYILSIT